MRLNVATNDTICIFIQCLMNTNIGLVVDRGWKWIGKLLGAGKRGNVQIDVERRFRFRAMPNSAFDDAQDKWDIGIFP